LWRYNAAFSFLLSLLTDLTESGFIGKNFLSPIRGEKGKKDCSRSNEFLEDIQKSGFVCSFVDFFRRPSQSIYIIVTREHKTRADVSERTRKGKRKKESKIGGSSSSGRVGQILNRVAMYHRFAISAPCAK
jgi:hypothetical protein